jgi:hypothetical protein
MLELVVPVGVTGPIQRLAVGLQAVPQVAQQPGHHTLAGAVPHPNQLRGQPAQALAGPTQRGLRVAPGYGLYQPLQVPQQGRVFSNRLLASTAFPTNTSASDQPRLRQLLHAFSDSTPGYACCLGNRSGAAPTQNPGFRGRHQTTGSLVQHRRQQFKSSLDHFDINHDQSIQQSA